MSNSNNAQQVGEGDTVCRGERGTLQRTTTTTVVLFQDSRDSTAC